MLPSRIFLKATYRENVGHPLEFGSGSGNSNNNAALDSYFLHNSRGHIFRVIQLANQREDFGFFFGCGNRKIGGNKLGAVNVAGTT